MSDKCPDCNDKQCFPCWERDMKKAFPGHAWND